MIVPLRVHQSANPKRHRWVAGDARGVLLSGHVSAPKSNIHHKIKDYVRDWPRELVNVWCFDCLTLPGALSGGRDIAARDIARPHLECPHPPRRGFDALRSREAHERILRRRAARELRDGQRLRTRQEKRAAALVADVHDPAIRVRHPDSLPAPGCRWLRAPIDDPNGYP